MRTNVQGTLPTLTVHSRSEMAKKAGKTKGAKEAEAKAALAAVELDPDAWPSLGLKSWCDQPRRWGRSRINAERKSGRS
jgi:hypothetical protein